MFAKIAVAYDESPEAGRALKSAIELAKILGAGLQAITVMESLPAYTGFATAADPAMTRTLVDDRLKYYDQLQTKARARAARDGVQLVAHLVDGAEADCIVRFVCEQKIDLLVIGIHRRHDRVSRMWSTVYTVAQNVPCDVLGVH